MPAAAERTYSFRAPGDLGDRIRDASAFMDELADTAGTEIAERVARELVLAILRDHARFHGVRDNQSAFVRETVELVVNAAQKVASDIRYADAYAGAADLRSDEEREFRRAARNRAARRVRGA
jgi:hypothetical protein